MPASPDAVDLNNLRETVQSAGYALIWTRIWEELETQRLKLEVPANNADYHRGAVAMLRCVLGIPGIIEAEIKDKLK